jgi:hypothetical protein
MGIDGREGMQWARDQMWDPSPEVLDLQILLLDQGSQAVPVREREDGHVERLTQRRPQSPRQKK